MRRIYERGKHALHVRALSRLCLPYKAGMNRNGRVAGFMALLLLSLQIMSAAHFILIPHNYDFETGKVVSCSSSQEDHSHNHSQPFTNQSDPENSKAEMDDCRVHALLKQSQIQPVPVCGILFITPALVRLPNIRDNNPADFSGLYLISPSQSPPVAAFS